MDNTENNSDTVSDISDPVKIFMLEFIELYRQHPCLWKVKDPDYHNREKKDAAYAILVSKYRTFNKLANRKIIAAKLNSLRTGYRRELKRIKEIDPSLSGSSAEGVENAAQYVYEGSLYYFTAMEFLRDQETPRESVSNMMEIPAPSVLQGNNIPSCSTAPTVAVIQGNGNTTPNTTSARMTNPYSRENRKKNKTSDNVEQQFMATLTAALQQKETESYGSILAKAWSQQYEALPQNQKVHVEKLVNEVFYAGRLGKLNEVCRVITEEELLYTEPEY